MKNYKYIIATVTLTLSAFASADNYNHREARSGEVFVHCSTMDMNDMRRFNHKFLPDDITAGEFNENDTMIGLIHFRKKDGILVSAPSITRLINRSAEICVTITKK